MNKLEEKFQYIMKEFGHDVLVLHNDKNEVCSCYDPVTGSINSKCPYCFGIGHVPQIKKYRTRYKDARIPQSNAFMMTNEPFGEMSVDAKVYYFYKDKVLKEGDLIIEVDWEDDRPVYKGRGVRQVAHVDPLRYIGGEINHYRVYVKGEPIDMEIRGIQIVRRAGQIEYILAENKPYQVKDKGTKQNPEDRLQFPIGGE